MLKGWSPLPGIESRDYMITKSYALLTVSGCLDECSRDADQKPRILSYFRLYLARCVCGRNLMRLGKNVPWTFALTSGVAHCRTYPKSHKPLPSLGQPLTESEPTTGPCMDSRVPGLIVAVSNSKKFWVLARAEAGVKKIRRAFTLDRFDEG